MNSKIEFNYEGKDYTLEYDRKSIKIMEANGFKYKDLDNCPLSMIEMLWQGAFLKNHKNERSDIITTIYEKIQNKTDLNAGLISMFTETYTSLIGDSEENDNSKNIEWKMI